MIGRGFGGIPHAVKNLLIINGIMFVLLLIFENSGTNLNFTLGLFYWKSAQFEPYQIITHMFMHGGLTHILFNMFALWMFGSPLEQIWGPKRFLIFYLLTGLGAAFLHMMVIHFQAEQLMAGMAPGDYQEVLNNGFDVLMQGKNYQGVAGQLNELVNIPTIGASGAVFGILAGFAMFFPNTELMLIFFPIPIKAKYFVLIYAVLELVLGVTQFQGDNIAHFAHVGGALFGFLIIKFWQRSRRNFY
jgi:rhomboid family protein